MFILLVEILRKYVKIMFAILTEIKTIDGGQRDFLH